MIYEFRYYRSCYKKVIELEKRYNINKVKIFNSIQTNGINNYSLKSKAFGKFIEDIFQCWYDDIKKGQYVSIRYFDNLIAKLLGYNVEECGMKGSCSCQFVVEADGGVYPCDFYVIDKWYIGNINNKSFEELYKSDVVKRFINSSKEVDSKCKKCKCFNLCMGGCRRNIESLLNNKISLNYFCDSYKYFFENNIEKLFEAASIISRMRI